MGVWLARSHQSTLPLPPRVISTSSPAVGLKAAPQTCPSWPVRGGLDSAPVRGFQKRTVPSLLVEMRSSPLLV